MSDISSALDESNDKTEIVPPNNEELSQALAGAFTEGLKFHPQSPPPTWKNFSPGFKNGRHSLLSGLTNNRNVTDVVRNASLINDELSRRNNDHLPRESLLSKSKQSVAEERINNPVYHNVSLS